MDKKQKETINLINKKDSNCFQYALTFALNHKEIKKDPQRTMKTKLFPNKHNWKGTNFPSERDIGKKLRKIM